MLRYTRILIISAMAGLLAVSGVVTAQVTAQPALEMSDPIPMKVEDNRSFSVNDLLFFLHPVGSGPNFTQTNAVVHLPDDEIPYKVDDLSGLSGMTEIDCQEGISQFMKYITSLLPDGPPANVDFSQQCAATPTLTLPELIMADIRDESATSPIAIHTGEHLSPYTIPLLIPGATHAFAPIRTNGALDGLVMAKQLSSTAGLFPQPQIFLHRFDANPAAPRLQLKGGGTGWLGSEKCDKTKTVIELAKDGCVSEKNIIELETPLWKNIDTNSSIVTINNSPHPLSGNAFITLYNPKANAPFINKNAVFKDLFVYSTAASLLNIKTATAATVFHHSATSAADGVMVAGLSGDPAKPYHVAFIAAGNDINLDLMQITVPLTIDFSKDLSDPTLSYYPFHISSGDLNKDGCSDFLVTWGRDIVSKVGDVTTTTVSCAEFFDTFIATKKADGSCLYPYAFSKGNRYYAPSVEKDDNGKSSAEAEICVAEITTADINPDLGEGICNDANRDCLPDVWAGDYAIYPTSGKTNLEGNAFIHLFKGIGNGLLNNLTGVQSFVANKNPIESTDGRGGVKALAVDRFGNVGVSMGPLMKVEKDFTPPPPPEGDGCPAGSIQEGNDIPSSFANHPDGNSDGINDWCQCYNDVDQDGIGDVFQLILGGETIQCDNCPPRRCKEAGVDISQCKNTDQFNPNFTCPDPVVELTKCITPNAPHGSGDPFVREELEAKLTEVYGELTDFPPQDLGDADLDNDGVLDFGLTESGDLFACDNCPAVACWFKGQSFNACANANQQDSNSDGYGDVCANVTCPANSSQNAGKIVPSKYLLVDNNKDGVSDYCQGSNCVYDKTAGLLPPPEYRFFNMVTGTNGQGNQVQTPSWCYCASDGDQDGYGDISFVDAPAAVTCDNCSPSSNSSECFQPEKGIPSFISPFNTWSGQQCWNPTQKDVDKDGKGNACDPTPIQTLPNEPVKPRTSPKPKIPTGSLFLPDRVIDPNPTAIAYVEGLGKNAFTHVAMTVAPGAPTGLPKGFFDVPDLPPADEQVTVLINKRLTKDVPPPPPPNETLVNTCRVDVGRGQFSAGLHDSDYVMSLNDRVRAITGLPVDLFIGELGYYDAYCVLPGAEASLFNGTPALAVYQKEGSWPVNYSKQMYRPKSTDRLESPIRLLPNLESVDAINPDLAQFNIAVGGLPPPSFSYSVPGVDANVPVALSYNKAVSSYSATYQISGALVRDDATPEEGGEVMQIDMGLVENTEGAVIGGSPSGDPNLVPDENANFFIRMQGFSALDLCFWETSYCENPIPYSKRFVHSADDVIKALEDIVAAHKAANQPVGMNVFDELAASITWDEAGWAQTTYVVPTGQAELDLHLFLINPNVSAQGGCNCHLYATRSPSAAWTLVALATGLGGLMVIRRRCAKVGK